MYEPHLLQPQAYNDMLRRLNQLSAESQALWGKMDVAQMMAHLTAALEVAMGDEKATQTLLGRLIGSVTKRQVLTNGLPKNSPTAPKIKISDQRQFQREQQRLRLQLERFMQAGEAGITRQPNVFFGHLTSNEWARLQYVHLDHHFKQFGV